MLLRRLSSLFDGAKDVDTRRNAAEVSLAGERSRSAALEQQLLAEQGLAAEV